MKENSEFATDAEIAIAKIRRIEIAIERFRRLAPSLILICFSASTFGFIQGNSYYPDWCFLLLALIIWICTISLFLRDKPKEKVTTIANFEEKYGIAEFSPLSEYGTKIVSGNQILWDDFRARAKSIAIPNPNLIDFITKNDAKNAGLLLAGIILLVINFRDGFNFLALNPFGSRLAPQSVQLILNDENAPKYGERIQFSKNDKFKIEISGDNNAKIFFDDRAFPVVSSQAFALSKSGRLKIFSNGRKFFYEFQLKPTQIPSFAGPISSKENKGQFDFQAIIKNPQEVKNINIELSGFSEDGKFIEETTPLLASTEDAEVQNIHFDANPSALVGSRVFAHLVLLDTNGNKHRSYGFWFNIPKPEINDEFAAALQEIRLNLLRENEPYRAYFPQKFTEFDPQTSNEIVYDNTSYSDFAPQSVQHSLLVLRDFEKQYEALAIDERSHLGLIYAIENLDRARNLTEAKKSTDILWEIIEGKINIQKGAKARIAETIERLKQALQNKAPQSQIDGLKQELRDAIVQRVQELQNERQESGDMQVEDSASIHDDEVNQTIDSLNSNSGDATQKLDELNNILQNMQLQEDGSNGSQSAENSGDAMEQAQKLMEDTQNSEGSNLGELANRQKSLSEQLKSRGDKKLNSAAAAMDEAAQALQNGDKERAIDAQQRAIEELSKALNEGDNTDPLGRENKRRSNSVKKNENQNIIPQEDEGQKSREILDQLRRKSNNPNNDKRDKDYYDNLLRGN